MKILYIAASLVEAPHFFGLMCYRGWPTTLKSIQGVGYRRNSKPVKGSKFLDNHLTVYHSALLQQRKEGKQEPGCI